MEDPAGSNADNADLDSTAEELDVEDPGLRDLAMRLTDNALHHGLARPGSQATGEGSAALASGDAAAVKEEPVDDADTRLGREPEAADADPEMQLLQVNHRQLTRL